VNDSYSSPLAERYASEAMLALWSAQARYGLWRRLWVALAESERELGVAIPESAIAQMRAAVDNINFGAVAGYEKKLRHDVMAHVHAFGDAAPDARAFIHLGATSAYVTDNADLILMRRGMSLLRDRIVEVLRSLSEFAKKWKSEPTLGYTHLQPAQLTTVGKRATLWMQDLVLDLKDMDHRIATLPFRGVKGTTGTQASFLEIFEGNHDKVRQLDAMVTKKMGFSSSLAVTGQTYSRKLDSAVLGAVAGVASSAGKFSGDVRILQSFGEIEEPFDASQVGSSAMAYKRNPMRSERIASLARFVLSLEPNANQTHAAQFLERTLDDSANRRLVIPESFLATDAILLLMHNVASGLTVNREVIRRRVSDELPFMATEKLIMRAVRAGGDRQDAHETIRRHSMDTTKAIREHGTSNDLLDRLAADKSLGISAAELKKELSPDHFVGRAPQQVDEFLAEVVGPILSERRERPSSEELRV
jgi:adenylosuccinate lyase